MELNLNYFINKNIRNLLLILWIMLIIAAIFLQQILFTISNIFFSPFELDYVSAFTSNNLVSLQGISDLSSLDSGKGTKVFDIELQNMANYKNAYRQNKKYKFIMRPIDVYDIDLSYETTYYGGLFSFSKPFNSHKYILLDTGKVLILTKVAPDLEIIPNQIFKGVFLPLTDTLKDDVQKTIMQGHQLDNVFVYELDTLTNFANYEKTDTILVIGFLITILFIVIKFLYYKMDYRHHPTYKQLDKLFGSIDENEASINSELKDEANLVINKNTYATKHWVIRKRFFKTRISMAMKP